MKVFLGPPGTGKTFRLLQELETELQDGVPAESIAFVAFTRKAAYEARDRAMKKFDLQEEQLPWFRTLHSLAFKALHLSREDVMTGDDYQEIGNTLGMPFGDVEEDVEEDVLLTPGDKRGSNCAYLEQISRLSGLDLELICTRSTLERYYDVKLYRDTLDSYKRSRSKIDFTDMLEMFLAKAPVLGFQVVVLDEAQDLTFLQWEVVRHITTGAERVYIAGDDDQAIYEWAGADVQTFLGLQGTFENLTQSHRVPQVVHRRALKILSPVRERYEKTWEPKQETGSIEYYLGPEQVDYSQGSWLLLCRNRYMLPWLCSVLKRLGFPFIIHGKSSVDNDNVKALLAWETLRKGEAIGPGAARTLVKKLREKTQVAGLKEEDVTTIVKKDFEGPDFSQDWMTALQIPDHYREYLRAIRRHGESLFHWPRITVSTIHQAKGGEADHVLVVPDISEACYRSMVQGEASESRVFYVAVTRAKKSLHIVQPRTNRYYDLRG